MKQGIYDSKGNRIGGISIPDESESPVRSSDLLSCAAALCEIVEGITSPNDAWRSKSLGGMRLKDTPEWCAFYVALNLAKKEAQDNR